MAAKNYREDPFGNVSKTKVKAYDPFAVKQSRQIIPSIKGVEDPEALLSIMRVYMEDRRRKAEIGAITADEAAADCARAGKLSERLLKLLIEADGI